MADCLLDSIFPYRLSTDADWPLLIVHFLPTAFTILFYLACECSDRRRITTTHKRQSLVVGGLAFGVVGLLGGRAIEQLRCVDGILSDSVMWMVVTVALSIGLFGLHFVILTSVPRLSIVIALGFASFSLLLEFALRNWWIEGVLSVVSLLVPLQQAFCIVAVCLIAWLPGNRRPLVSLSSVKDMNVFVAEKKQKQQDRRPALVHADPLRRGDARECASEPGSRTSLFW